MLTGDHLSDMGRAIHNLFDGQLRALNPVSVTNVVKYIAYLLSCPFLVLVCSW